MPLAERSKETPVKNQKYILPTKILQTDLLAPIIVQFDLRS
jgi:hypothetical protein